MTQRLGLAVFILYLVQVFIGTVIHKFKPKSAAIRRPLQNYFHVVLGILIIILSFVQVRSGYKVEYPQATGRLPLPKAADIVFYLWAAVSFQLALIDRYPSHDSDRAPLSFSLTARSCSIPRRPCAPSQAV